MAQLLTLGPGGIRSHDLRHPHDLRYAAWRPDGAEIMVVGNQGAAGLWDGAATRWLGGGGFDNLRGCGWAPDGAQAAIVGNGGTVLRYRNGRLAREPFASPVALRRVAWSPTGETALIAGNDGLLLQMGRGGPRRAAFAESHLRAVQWMPEGDRALICANGGLYLHVAGGEDLERLHREEGGDLIGICLDAGSGRFWVSGFKSAPGSMERRLGILYRGKLDSLKLEIAAEPVPDLVWTGVARLAKAGDVVVVGDSGETGARQILGRLGKSGNIEPVAGLGDFHPAGVIASPEAADAVPESLREVQAIIFGSPRSRFYRA
ncbi:MAG: hypothetical protein HY682_01545 [Chloroflexi bacterium]|nr:hypothetical protein [Chloroflexota bacterium]